MVYGAISYNWKSKLVFFQRSRGKGICTRDYLNQVPKPVIAPAFSWKTDYHGVLQRGRYVEDHAPIHGTKGLLNVEKALLGIPLHYRPASSPDLNPIENVWSILKQRIKAYPVFPNTVEKLKAVVVQDEWDRLQPEDWNKYIDSMPDRVAEVNQRKGLATRY